MQRVREYWRRLKTSEPSISKVNCKELSLRDWLYSVDKD